MNKLLPILLVLSFASNSNAEYRSKAEEMLGKDCVNLECELADKLCGKKDMNGVRKINDDDCKMKIARENMKTGNTSYIKPPSKDPCLKMDCSTDSELASEICFNFSSNKPQRLTSDECKMRIKRYQQFIINEQTHEQTVNLFKKKYKNYDYNHPYVDEKRERRAIESYKYKSEPYGVQKRSDAWNRCMAKLMVDPVGKHMRGIDAANLCDSKTR